MSSLSINTASTANPIDMYGIMNSFAINPVVLGIVVVIFVIFLLFFSSMGGAGGASSESGFGIADMGMGTGAGTGAGGIFLGIIVAILVILAAYKVFQYFFSINVTAGLGGLFGPKPELDVTVDHTAYGQAPVPEQHLRKQVFNIPGNTYGYDDAKAVCQAYGARLATYKEVEEAYHKGGEWCNYGWSDGQMALFPTQQASYDALQKVPGHEHDCGRPGVNGGFIDNPHAKFGVNCYGHKPLITQQESNIMETTPPYPVTEKDIAFQRRVDYWKQRLADVLVSPFNHRLWNQII